MKGLTVKRLKVPRNPYVAAAKNRSGAGPHKFNRKAALAEIRAREAEREADRYKR